LIVINAGLGLPDLKSIVPIVVHTAHAMELGMPHGIGHLVLLCIAVTLLMAYAAAGFLPDWAFGP
jgi:hypothetical protein